MPAEHKEISDLILPLPLGAAQVCLQKSDLPLHLLPEEQLLLSPAATSKRIEEFTLGRMAARQALEKLGLSPAPSILRDTERAPLWPEGFIGSITHTLDKNRQALAIAVAAPNTAVLAIGIDLEATKRSRQDISRHVLLAEEQQWVQNSADPQLSLLLAFSAKESLYKCLHPLCRRFFGFKEVQLTQKKDGELNATLLTTLNTELSQGYTLSVYYTIQHGFILTGCWLAPSP